jgi:hypothetical protein
MGREKDRLIEEDERGWYSVTRKLVCDSCVRDEYLSAYIRKNGKPAVCGYCGLEPEERDLRCIPFDDLMDVIGDGINWAYTSADKEHIPYESAEGGYAFPEAVFDTYDLVTDQVGLEVDPAVLEDVLRALPEQTWCQRDFWSLSLNAALRLGWQEFVEMVKYGTRYLFILPQPASSRSGTPPLPAPVIEAEPEPNSESSGLFDPYLRPDYAELPTGDPDFGIDYDRQEGIPVDKMLDAIGLLVRRLRLTRIVDAGTTIYRVRVVDKGRNLAGPLDFGPPQRESATQPNRMSPAGIVMFYGAMDRATALVETFQSGRDGAANKNVWLSSFTALKELHMLDLTDLPSVPSMFDASSRDLQNAIAFLHGFVGDLVEPIARDGHEHIEYVPTQIVTEYVRHRFRTEDDGRLEGVLYRSSKRPAGVACVLFIDGTSCGVPTEAWKEPEQVLRLLEDQTEVLDGASADRWYPTA